MDIKCMDHTNEQEKTMLSMKNCLTQALFESIIARNKSQLFLVFGLTYMALEKDFN